MGVSTLPDSHFGQGTKLIMDKAESLGFKTQKMPKFINHETCKPCGKCAFGCPRDSKWTSRKYVDEAVDFGAKVIDNTAVAEIIIKNGELKGVKSKDKEFLADCVVLSAGGIETPRILNRSGIDAGNNLFVDTFVTVGGILGKIDFNTEVAMISITLDDVILSPHYLGILHNKLMKFNVSEGDIIGLMIEIADESSGTVLENSVKKYSTSNDVSLLPKDLLSQEPLTK